MSPGNHRGHSTRIITNLLKLILVLSGGCSSTNFQKNFIDKFHSVGHSHTFSKRLTTPHCIPEKSSSCVGPTEPRQHFLFPTRFFTVKNNRKTPRRGISLEWSRGTADIPGYPGAHVAKREMPHRYGKLIFGKPRAREEILFNYRRRNDRFCFSFFPYLVREVQQVRTTRTKRVTKTCDGFVCRTAIALPSSSVSPLTIFLAKSRIWIVVSVFDGGRLSVFEIKETNR